jgi:hypothetical protein
MMYSRVVGIRDSFVNGADTLARSKHAVVRIHHIVANFTAIPSLDLGELLRWLGRKRPVYQLCFIPRTQERSDGPMGYTTSRLNFDFRIILYQEMNSEAKGISNRKVHLY